MKETNKEISYMNIPSNYYISSGTGRSKYRLGAFDNALISAGISNYNLLRVSSILPAKCKQKKNIQVKFGAHLLTAFASISSNHKGEQISSCVAVGIPKNKDEIGVIMEYSDSASEEEVKQICKNMVEDAMQNHSIEIEDIIISSITGIVGDEEYLSLISALAMW